METITGTVHRVLWSSPEEDNDYKVFKIRKKGNEYETVTGNFPELIDGAEIEVHGEFSDHPRYGRGFKAKAHVFTFNRDSTYSISLYLQSITKFLGPKRAYAIAHTFGKDLEDVIENHSEKLLEVEDVGEVVAKNLIDSWFQHRNEKNVRIFLHGLGLSEKQIKRILLSVGTDAETKIKENPFLLCLFGFGFSTCDYIAKKLGIDPKSPIRLKYFVIYVLRETRNNGHLYLRAPQIVAAFNAYNERTTYHFKANEIFLEDIKDTLEDLVENAYIINEDDKYYELDSYFFENESARLLSLIHKKPDLCTGFKDLDAEEFIKYFEGQERLETGIQEFSLSDDQKDAIRSFVTEKILIITGNPGTGKCLGKDTPILMYDGTIKLVQDIKIGDLLMGDDSTPRKVLSLARGREELFNVIPRKGDPYTVNRSHILSLVSNTKYYKGFKKDSIIDISVNDYLKLPEGLKGRLKGYRVPIDFEEREVPISPYLIGFWLGNGSQGDTRISTPFQEVIAEISDIVKPFDLFVRKDVGDGVDYRITTGKKGNTVVNVFRNILRRLDIYNTRKIPKLYKCNSKENRLKLLAGLIDSDGYYDEKGKGYEITFKYKQLIEDTTYLARSLGYSAYPKKCKKTWDTVKKGKHYTGKGDYYRMFISGDDLEEIPVKVKKKRAKPRLQCKNPLRTGITLKSLGEGDYYGFEIDGNKRFLLGDFTVTHNTTITKAFVNLLMKHSINFELLTPTGIAAKKLGNTAGFEAYTIHRRLGYQGTSSWGYNTHNKYSTEVVIVDEMSMVDMEVFYRLISALYTSTKIVFVGDNDQLPSVGPGRVLNELIKSKAFKTIQLRNIFRQAEQSDIIKEAKKIKDGDIDLSLFKGEQKADIWFIRHANSYWIEQKIVEFSKGLKDSIKSSNKNTTFQIITPRNNGPLSVETLNSALQNALNPKKNDDREIKLKGGCTLRVGDRVLIKRNNYDLDVFNGDIGKIVAFVQANIHIDIDDFNCKRRIEVPMELADDMLKLAYSITVHKCIPGFCRINAKEGLIRIKNLESKSLVTGSTLTDNKVKWVGETGVKDVYEIQTRQGYTTFSSSDHRFFTPYTNNQYTKLKNLKKGDFLSLCLKPVEGSDFLIDIDNHLNYNQTELNLPKYLTTDLSWLLGIMIADGCYTDDIDGTIEITKQSSLDILSRIKKIVSKIGINVQDHNRKNKPFSIYFISKNFREWLLKLGFGYSYSKEKHIPEFIFNLTIENRLSFLAGLLDGGGGCIDNRAFIRYTTASCALAEGLQKLLLSLGIPSTKKEENKNHYKINIGSLGYDRIKKSITLTNKKKQKRLDRYSTSGKTNLFEIPNGKDVVTKFLELYKKNEGLSQGIKGKGLSSKHPKFFQKCYRVLKGKNQLRLPDIYNMCSILNNEGIDIPEYIQKLNSGNIFFDKIKNIKYYGKVKTYDMTVDSDPSYVSDGFFCHNSQGSEYDLVILPIVKSHGKKILQRNLLYTAITRSKKKVIVFGQAGALVDAIENDKIQERNTLLSERIKKWTTSEGITLHQLCSNYEDCQNAENLKRLLLCEEKASLEKVTIEKSPSGEMGLKKKTKESSKVAPSRKQSSMQLINMLKEVEELTESLETSSSTPVKKRTKKKLRKKV